MKVERQRPFLAVYCLLENESGLLVMQRQNTGYADGYWSIPSGHVDKGESIREAASRELYEEVGISIHPSSWSIRCLLHRKTDKRQVLDIFLSCENWSGIPTNMEPSKCAAIAFHCNLALPQPFLPYVLDSLKVIGPVKGIGFSSLESGWE